MPFKRLFLRCLIIPRVFFSLSQSATHLRHLDRRKFAFVLADGTHGVCDGTAVLWTRRTARERRVTCISGFDADDSGSAQLALGYSDGTVEVRLENYGLKE